MREGLVHEDDTREPSRATDCASRSVSLSASRAAAAAPSARRNRPSRLRCSSTTAAGAPCRQMTRWPSFRAHGSQFGAALRDLLLQPLRFRRFVDQALERQVEFAQRRHAARRSLRGCELTGVSSAARVQKLLQDVQLLVQPAVDVCARRSAPSCSDAMLYSLRGDFCPPGQRLLARRIPHPRR